jgi:hypothetical protein
MFDSAMDLMKASGRDVLLAFLLVTMVAVMSSLLDVSTAQAVIIHKQDKHDSAADSVVEISNTLARIDSNILNNSKKLDDQAEIIKFLIESHVQH